MDADALDRFFVRTFDDLEQRRDSRDEYELTRAAALLRQLLIDAKPSALAVAVAKRHRVKLKFPLLPRPPVDTRPVVCSITPIAGFFKGVPLESIAEVHEMLIASGKLTRASLDELLAREVLRVGTDAFTVRGVVRYFAHVEGGVHVGTPDPDENEIALRDALKGMGSGTISMGHKLLEDISRATLAGLRPVRDKAAAQFLVARRKAPPRSK